jgi:Zn finger protein HypA/HybF involved in hydrogenase expression
VDSEAKAGYLLVSMAITAFCTSCQRTVYVEQDDTHVCPVCSTPLLEVVPAGEAVEGPESAHPDQAEGAK